MGHGGDPKEVQRAAQIADLEILKRVAIASKVSAMEENPHNAEIEEKEPTATKSKRKWKRRRGKKQTVEAEPTEATEPKTQVCEEKSETTVKKCVTTIGNGSTLKRDPLSVDVTVFSEERKEDVHVTPAVCREAVTFECVEERCGFSSAVLWLYLRHYKEQHLKEEAKNGESETQLCMCGQRNTADALFCVECGWDLRYKPMIESDTKTECSTKPKTECVAVSSSAVSAVSADALLQTNGKSIVIRKTKAPARKRKRGVLDVEGYWSCRACSFYNHKSSARCLVCAMVDGASESKSKSASTSWAATISAKPKVKVQHKKNKLGWICSACTFENVPAARKCSMCENPKSKKTKKKKKNKEYHADPHYDEDLEAELASYTNFEKPWEKYEK